MKLSFGTIVIMAVSVAIGVVSFGWFHQWVPTQQAITNYETYRGQLETEKNKMAQAKRRVERAKAEVQAKTEAWNAYVATRTPEPDVSRGGINLAVDSYQLTVDTQKFRNSIQRAVNEQVKKGGVKVINGPEVRGPKDTNQASLLLSDYYNYPGIKFPVVIFDLGSVTVEGTYDQIMANVRSYKSMPRYLAVADGLQLTGTSPHLTGTYTLSIVGFIRGKQIFPALTTEGAPSGGSGGFGGGFGGGFRGGPPGGFPGGPPGGFAGAAGAPARGGGGAKAGGD